MAKLAGDKSNGYEEAAERFMAARSSRIGVATVQKWSEALPRGGAVLDLGCGHGVPVSETLIERGFAIYGVDASAKLIAEYRKRFPIARAEFSAAEESEFFHRAFAGVVAWGLLFLLSREVQEALIYKVAGALNQGGKFLFTAPMEAVFWSDSLTDRESVSLGEKGYEQILRSAGMELVGNALDEGGNYYYFSSKA